MDSTSTVLQVLGSSALSNIFELKERTGSAPGFESISWIDDEECRDATRHQAYGECRMYFSQERFSNLPLASSQIQITRKRIKEELIRLKGFVVIRKKNGIFIGSPGWW